jgi:hypothetical protein
MQAGRSDCWIVAATRGAETRDLVSSRNIGLWPPGLGSCTTAALPFSAQAASWAVYSSLFLLAMAERVSTWANVDFAGWGKEEGICPVVSTCPTRTIEEILQTEDLTAFSDRLARLQRWQPFPHNRGWEGWNPPRGLCRATPGGSKTRSWHQTGGPERD